MLIFDTDALQIAMAADPPLGYDLMRRFSAVMFDRLVATRQQLTGEKTRPAQTFQPAALRAWLAGRAGWQQAARRCRCGWVRLVPDSAGFIDRLLRYDLLHKALLGAPDW